MLDGLPKLNGGIIRFLLSEYTNIVHVSQLYVEHDFAHVNGELLYHLLTDDTDGNKH